MVGTVEKTFHPQLLLCDIHINMLSASKYIMYRSPTTQYASDLDLDFSRSPKDKCGGAIGLSLYDFLSVFIVTYGRIQLLSEI